MSYKNDPWAINHASYLLFPHLKKIPFSFPPSTTPTTEAPEEEKKKNHISLLLKFLNQMFSSRIFPALFLCVRKNFVHIAQKLRFYLIPDEKSLLQFFFAFHWLKARSQKKTSRHKKIRIFIVWAQKTASLKGIFLLLVFFFVTNYACKDDGSWS